MRLTDEQKTAVFYDTNLALKSCPGSGKTHTIIAKLLRVIEGLKDTTRQVGCITYMNSAVDEICYRISMHLGRDYEENCTIETIHSFCLNNIFRQNHWRIKYFRTGYTILSPDDQIYKDQIKEIIRNYSLNSRAYEYFELISRRNTDLPPYISGEARNAYWHFLDSNGYVDFDSIIFYSAYLIEKYGFISSGLAAKYAWLLVDEFQDTSEFQVRIFTAIASHERTDFFLVGDPFQSIMGFAGGKPELMEVFGKSVSARNDLQLLGNFRSSSIIVDYANKLLPRQMQATGENKDFNIEPEWRHVKSIFEGLQDFFLPEVQARNIPWGQCAILGPNFFVLRDVARNLREFSIPIIGPGARPYRRSLHLIAPLAENMGSYLISNEPTLIKPIRKKMYELIINCEGKLPLSIFSFNGDLALAKIIWAAKRLAGVTPSALIFMDHFSVIVADILLEYGFISRISSGLIKESGKTIIEDINNHNRDVDVNNFSIEDLSLLAGGNSLRMLTVHKAKGREFDAVAMINVEEGKIPYGRPEVGSNAEAEAKRLFYVGITRARKLLKVFTVQQPSRFLKELFPNGPTID